MIRLSFEKPEMTVEEIAQATNMPIAEIRGAIARGALDAPYKVEMVNGVELFTRNSAPLGAIWKWISRTNESELKALEYQMFIRWHNATIATAKA